MIKIELIDSFLLVAKLGGISKAADKKSLSAMALSKQMRLLEERVGHPLFIRTGRRIALTEFGYKFKNEAEKLAQSQASLLNCLDEVSGTVSGTLRVLFQSPMLCDETIIPWLPQFLDTYPNINVELDVKESLIDIAEDDYDIFWGISEYLGEQCPNLKRRDLWTSRYGVYASPHYIAKRGLPTHPDDLDSHDIVGYLHNQPSNVLVLQERGRPIYRTLNQRVASVTGMVELAIAGLGLVNAGDDVKQIDDAVKAKQLIPVLEDYWWQEAKVFIYYHNVRHHQPKVKAFIDFFLAKRDIWANA